MPVSITLQEIPVGSQLVSAIGADDPDSKNDFRVRISLDGNGTGLTEDGITFSTGASLVELTGVNSVWEATIRPPVTAQTVTITIAADAFTEGNVETSQDIEVVTDYPATDAETPTSVFTHGVSNVRGIAVSPTRILIGSGRNNYSEISLTKFTHAGVEQTSEESSVAGAGEVRGNRRIDFINGDILVSGGLPSESAARRYREDGSSLIDIARYAPFQGTGIIHTRLGILGISNADVDIRDYANTETTEQQLPGLTYRVITHQDDLLYLADSAKIFGLAEINSDDEINFVTKLNINAPAAGTIRDISIYQDTLYILTTTNVYTLDIRKYRPIAKNTKTTIYPVFATNGDTLPLSQYCPDAKDFTFSVGFDKPTYLSINADNEIAIASSAVTETTPVLVKCTGINYIDSADFSFYLIIVPASAPEWRDVESLSMKANTTYNLHPIVDADSVAFESGETQPTGSSIANGVFTIATTAGTAYFRATKDGLTTDKAIQIDVIQPQTPITFPIFFAIK